MLLLFLSFLYSLFTVQNIFLEGGVRPLLWGSTSAFVHTQETLLGWGMASRRAGPHGRPKVWARYAQLHRGGGSDDWAKSGGVGDRTAGMEESNLFIGSGGTWVRGFLGDSWDLGVWWGHFSEVSNCCYCLVAQSCPTLCSPVGCSLPGSSVLGISQTKILEWVAISFSRRSSWTRDWTLIFCIGSRFFTTEPLGIQSTFIRAGGNVKKKLPCGSDSKESACSVGHPSLSPGSVHGVAKSWTRLSDFTF